MTVLLESTEHNESEQNKHVVWKVETSQKEVGDGASSQLHVESLHGSLYKVSRNSPNFFISYMYVATYILYKQMKNMY